MFPLVYLIMAVIFFAAGVMMFVVMHTLFKELPHAEHIATLYVLCFGAMAFSGLRRHPQASLPPHPASTGANDCWAS